MADEPTEPIQRPYNPPPPLPAARRRKVGRPVQYEISPMDVVTRIAFFALGFTVAWVLERLPFA